MSIGGSAGSVDNLVTEELLTWLAGGADMRDLVAHALYPYVHTAIRKLCSSQGVDYDDGQDLEGKAWLKVVQRAEAMYAAGRIEHFGAALVYCIVQGCHVDLLRRKSHERDDVHYDDGAVEMDHDERLSDLRQVSAEKMIMARAALDVALKCLDDRDRETIDLFQHHLHICEDDCSDDENDSAIRARAVKHLAASLGVNLSTAYRRLDRAEEHLRQLLEDQI
jgi:DNA-directed RNA polymerase specialized sigma24 family protein